MRKKIVTQPSLFDQSLRQLFVLIPREKNIEKMDAVINANPEIVDMVHEDLTRNTCNKGAHGMSAEQILRVAIIRQLKKYSWRELAERLNDGVVLRWFTRFFTGLVPHFTTLNKAVHAISDTTWQKINDLLVLYAQKEKLEPGKKIRTDMTVVQSNILYPVDARLLWDAIRVLTRTMIRLRPHLPFCDFGYANRTCTTKRLCYKIVMAKGPKADKKRRKHYRRLIEVANEVFEMGNKCFHLLTDHESQALWEYDQLDHYLTMTAVAIDQCERRVLKGEKVPAEHKIVSIFESHTDIICRGKSGSPVEFGHKVLFVTGKTGLITQYQVERGNPCDGAFLIPVIETHKRQYGKAPESVTADRRFFSADNEKRAYKAGVKYVAINKPGYRSKQRIKFEKEQQFKKMTRFRAGIEGIISGLSRGLGLKRCIWKGWKAFKRYVGLGVVTFNLRKIAQLQ